MWELSFGALAVFAGGVVQGTTGFGFALIAAPVLLLLYDPQYTTAVLVLLSLANNLIVICDARKSVVWRIVTPLLIGGVCGLPLGLYLLKHLEIASFKAGVGAVVALLALALLSGWRHKVRRESLGLAVTGVVSGVLNGAAALSGPPAILFFTNQGFDKQRFRANLIAYFLLLNIVTIALLAWSRMFSQPVFTGTALLLPAQLLGSYIGVRLSKVIPERLFRLLALILVIAVSLALIAVNAAAR